MSEMSKMVIMYGEHPVFTNRLEGDLERLGYSVDDPQHFTVLRHTKARTKTIKRWIKEDKE